MGVRQTPLWFIIPVNCGIQEWYFDWAKQMIEITEKGTETLGMFIDYSVQSSDQVVYSKIILGFNN